MSNIPFDTTDKTLQQDLARSVLKQVRAQRNGFLHDTGLASPKLGDPIKEPPHVPPLDRNPRRHDVVAWRNDGRIDSRKFDTKESAIEHGRALCWVVYYQWALMDGRDMVEKHAITIPDGMALDDNGMPVRLDGWTRDGDTWDNRVQS